MRLEVRGKFKLANRTWRVKRMRLPRGELGRTEFDKATIKLSRELEPGSELELHTFMHELLHATSGSMGWERVNGDEPRIDALAGLLVQAFTTATD
jgi:hypothetical protein